MLWRTIRALEPLAKAAFWAAFAFAVYMAVDPRPPPLGLERMGDKFQHMLAFSVLTALAQWGFGGGARADARGRWRIAERLSFVGALIEVVQSIPALHRDCDIRDWIADTVVIVAVTALFVLRDRVARPARFR